MIIIKIIVEHESGVTMTAHPTNATPFEIDIVRQIATIIKDIKPPSDTKDHTYIKNTPPNFKN